MNILIVDDHPKLARVTAIAFTVLGCKPFTARTTAEATQMLSAEKIDALFLDVNLAGESGFDYLTRLQAQPDSPPVVMFTAQNRDEVVDEARRRGALGCLVKPFTLDDLREQVARIEESLRQRREGTQKS